MSWNWGAFFTTFAWLLRRKLYLWAVAYFFVSTPALLLVAQEMSGEGGCAGALSPPASPYALWIVLALVALGWIAPALFADRLHARHLRKRGTPPSRMRGAWSAVLVLQTLMLLVWLLRWDYSNTLYREIIREGEWSAKMLKVELVQYVQDHGKLPTKLEEISHTSVDEPTTRVTLEANGAIHSVFVESARKLAGRSFTMVPILTSNSVYWACQSDIPNACLLRSCEFAEWEFWYQVEAAREKEAYEIYLHHFPFGVNAARAQTMLKSLDEEAARKKELASALATARSTNLAHKIEPPRVFRRPPGLSQAAIGN